MARLDSPSGRRQLLGKKLEKAGIKLAVVSNPKHIYYLTGFSTNLRHYSVLGKGQRSISFLSVGAGGEASLLVGRSEVRSPWARDDVGPKGAWSVPGFDQGLSLYVDYDLDVTMVPYADEIATQFRKWIRSVAKGHEGTRRVGIEDWHLPAIHRDVLSTVFGRAKLSGISGTIMEMRKTKGKDELENLRRATKALDYVYAFGKEQAKEGRTEMDMFRAMNDAAFQRYGVFGLIGGDVVSGDRNLEVGGTATNKKLKRGETVIIDMQTAHDNYWSDTARTFAIGRPSAAQEKALETVIEAKDLASRMLVPGTPTADVANAVNAFLNKKGYPAMPHHVGHTIGLDDQEEPWLIKGSRDVVKENQAYVIEPGVYQKGVGGVRVEDCYIVTSSGREKVSRFPLAF